MVLLVDDLVLLVVVVVARFLESFLRCLPQKWAMLLRTCYGRLTQW
jgi:hypothetical protein